MKPIFNPLIPVLSLSRDSKREIHSFPPLDKELSSSKSALYPCLIIPPSLIVNGGFSTIDASINSLIASKEGIDEAILDNEGTPILLIAFLILGTTFNDLLNWIKSFALALP